MYISCDPGISNFGIAVVDDSDGFKVVKTVLVKNIRKFTDEERSLETVYGSRTVKVLCILNVIRNLLDEYTIDYIVLEAPFYNALTPLAYGSLLEVISAIKYDIALKANLRFKLIEPLLVKKLFSKKGMASKELMKQFLITKQTDKTIALEASVDTLSEHEIDAVAVGFVHHLQLTHENQSKEE